VTTLSLIAWVALPLVWGWQSYTVISGSMGPLIRPGDVVVASPYDHRTPIRPGTLVVIEPPPHAQLRRPVTHRVIERLPDGRYQTKGDANPGPDSRLLLPGDIRAKARVIVPMVGQPGRLTGEHPLLLPAVLGLIGLLAGGAWLQQHQQRRQHRQRRQRHDRGDRPQVDSARMGRTRIAAVTVISLTAVAAWPTIGAAFSARTTPPGNSFSTNTQFYAREVIASGPVSYWRMGDASATVAADSVGSAPLTLSGTKTRGRPGALLADTDAATQFLATPTIGLGTTASPAPAGLAISGPLTVGAWVKVTATQPANARVVIKWNNSRLNYLLAWSSNGAAMRFLVDNSGGTRYTVQANYPYDSAWHFVVGVFDGAAIHLYQDGVEVATSVPVTGPLSTAVNDPVTVSASNSGMNGDVDEVAIWARALTAAQIANLYHVATT
jgi:signal peptidase